MSRNARLVLSEIPQREGHGAFVLLQLLHAAEGIALGRVIDQSVFEDFRELGQRVLARHHRAKDLPALEAGARPQRALFDHRQQAGIDQRGLARAAVAFDLQPAVVGRAAAAAQSVRIRLALVAQAGERFQGLLAPPEEQSGIALSEGIEAKKGAALDGLAGHRTGLRGW